MELPNMAHLLRDCKGTANIKVLSQTHNLVLLSCMLSLSLSLTLLYVSTLTWFKGGTLLKEKLDMDESICYFDIRFDHVG